MAGTMKCLLVIMIFVFSGDYVFGANTTTGTISVEVKNLPDGVSFQLSRAKKAGWEQIALKPLDHRMDW